MPSTTSRFLCGSALAVAISIGAVGAMVCFPPLSAAPNDGPLPSMPDGKLGEWIALGEAIVENTTEHPLSKEFVGNKLQCTSCHLQNGKHPTAGSFLETATAYPAWAPREQTVITLEDRVLNCFMRSCNGKRPPLGSKVSVAITTYITWLSQEKPIKMNGQRPVGPRAVPKLSVDASSANLENGKKLYGNRCAECHQENGEGDFDNPPVWGSHSFNQGAGLASVDNLASWLSVAMPPDEPNLSPQQAIDLAAYVNSHPRPPFSLKDHLPDSGKEGVYNGRSK